MINSLLYSVYAQARARTPARHALAILYAAAAALRAPRKLSPKQAFNTVQTGHARRRSETNLVMLYYYSYAIFHGVFTLIPLVREFC